MAIDCPANLELTISTAPSAIEAPFNAFRIEEMGAELEYSIDGKNWRPISLPATRSGVHSEVDYKGKIWLKSSWVAKARVRLESLCDRASADIQWEIQLQNIAEASDFSVQTKPEQMRLWAKQLAKEYQSATSDYRRALISHVLANQFWRLAELGESRRWFELASQSWGKIAHPVWRTAAHLGSVDLASRMKQINTLQPGDAAFQSFQGDAYYRVRFQEIACFLDKDRGQIDLAQRCMNDVVAGYSKIGESFDALNSRITQVYWLNETDAARVNIAAFRTLEANLPGLPVAHLYRGRYFLMLDYLYRVRGDFRAAMQSNLRAQREFQASTEESATWMGNAERLMASNLNRLGLYEQSLAMLQMTLQRIDAKSYPARAISVIDQLSQTFAQAGRVPEALVWQEKALVLRETLGLVADQAISRQRLQKLAPTRTGYQLFNPALPKAYFLDEQLLEAELLLLAGKATESQLKLNVLAGQALSEENQGKYAELQARNFLATGAPLRAVKSLSSFFQKRAQDLELEPSAALAFLKLRQLRALSRLWVDCGVEAELSASDLWQFAVLQNAARQLTPVTSAAAVSTAGAPTGDASFTDWLGEVTLNPRASARQLPTLAQFSASLPEDAIAFVLLPGNKQSFGLWIAKSSTEIVRLGSATQLDADISALTRWLFNKGAVAQLAALRAHFKPWWPKKLMVSGATKPDKTLNRLLIVADEATLAVPFAALMDEQTDFLEISYLTGLRIDNAPSGGASTKLNFFAPNLSTDDATRLDFIEREYKSISALQPTPFFGAAASRENLQMALQSPGWTHISAHGAANKQSFGLAGFKLSAGDERISWLEVSQIATQNALLVLNACDLAAATDVGRQANVSFALAASSSGAKNTIAAVWPVSDAASATWVPEFYQQLRGNPELAGAALRQAQLKLLHSPHFRHPYFWASLVHFRQWNIAATR